MHCVRCGKPLNQVQGPVGGNGKCAECERKKSKGRKGESMIRRFLSMLIRRAHA